MGSSAIATPCTTSRGFPTSIPVLSQEQASCAGISLNSKRSKSPTKSVEFLGASVVASLRLRDVSCPDIAMPSFIYTIFKAPYRELRILSYTLRYFVNVKNQAREMVLISPSGRTTLTSRYPASYIQRYPSSIN